MPLGADNIGGVDADVVTGLNAEAVGQKGGSEFKNISVDNLPEHEHDLRDSEGKTFYAVREIEDLTPDPNVEDFPLPYGDGQGQAFPQTGGILTNDDLGQPLNVMNPTLTVSYIIYTGRS
jgi:microcystin-dependent protein